MGPSLETSISACLNVQEVWGAEADIGEFGLAGKRKQP